MMGPTPVGVAALCLCLCVCVGAAGHTSQGLTAASRRVDATNDEYGFVSSGAGWLSLGEHLSELASKHTSLVCDACRVAADAFVWLLRHEKPSLLYDSIATICTVLGIEAPEVCEGVVQLNGPFLTYIAKNNPKLDGAMACGVLVQECTAGVASLNWTLDLTFMGSKPQRNASYANTTSPVEPYRILQLSDYHWDAEYTVGSTTICKEPICCRSPKHMGKSRTTSAGLWGDLHKCDMPWDAVTELHKHTNESEKFDIVYFMGDVVAHDIWETSRQKNMMAINRTMKAIKEAYSGYMVFPVIGNHEPHPINLLGPDTIKDEAFSTMWLYETLADQWRMWLPEDTRETILRGGFYTALVRPGFRVVSLNSVFCYKMNWWLLYDSVDPSGQLMWLAHVLLKAEEANEKVHILQHVPPGYKCLETWGRELNRIVDRFSDTITATFYGHTHTDDFRIFYGDDGLPNNVGFNGGSLTTFVDVNPNYKIYEVDARSWEISNVEAWVFNMTAANLLQPGQPPKWYQLYSFKETYGLSSVRPKELEQFVARLAKNTTLQQVYYRNHMLGSDIAFHEVCDSSCAKKLVCQIVTTVTGEEEHCKQFE